MASVRIAICLAISRLTTVLMLNRNSWSPVAVSRPSLTQTSRSLFERIVSQTSAVATRFCRESRSWFSTMMPSASPARQASSTSPRPRFFQSEDPDTEFSQTIGRSSTSGFWLAQPSTTRSWRSRLAAGSSLADLRPMGISLVMTFLSVGARPGLAYATRIVALVVGVGGAYRRELVDNSFESRAAVVCGGGPVTHGDPKLAGSDSGLRHGHRAPREHDRGAKGAKGWEHREPRTKELDALSSSSPEVS